MNVIQKLFPALALVMLASSAQASERTYECYRYVNGKPTGTWISVKASSKEEATVKAMARFRELGGQVDSANCK